MRMAETSTILARTGPRDEVSALAVDVERVHIDTCKPSESEVVVMRARDIVLSEGRRQELEAIARDALAHLQTDDSHARQEGVRALLNSVCAALGGYEVTTVRVQVMGDDVPRLPEWERWRLEEVDLVLLKRDLFAPVRGKDAEGTRSVVDEIKQLRLRPNEMETFQNYLHVWYAMFFFCGIFADIGDPEGVVGQCITRLAGLRSELRLQVLGAEGDIWFVCSCSENGPHT